VGDVTQIRSDSVLYQLPKVAKGSAVSTATVAVAGCFTENFCRLQTLREMVAPYIDVLVLTFEGETII